MSTGTGDGAQPWQYLTGLDVYGVTGISRDDPDAPGGNGNGGRVSAGYAARLLRAQSLVSVSVSWRDAFAFGWARKEEHVLDLQDDVPGHELAGVGKAFLIGCALVRLSEFLRPRDRAGAARATAGAGDPAWQDRLTTSLTVLASRYDWAQGLLAALGEQA